jgi:hypothetical protein
MAVRYRRWRNRIAEGGHVSQTPVEASMSAGDLFELEE